jgi:hypothetical protein
MRPFPAMLGMLSLCGCSWIFVERTPANHQQLVAFDCTTSVAAPVLDTVWGGLNLVGALSAAGANEHNWSGPADPATTVIVGVGWAIVSGVSAAYGFAHTKACREAKDDLYARLSRQQPPGYATNAGPIESVGPGCQNDVDCKGERICERHQCVFPGGAAMNTPAVPASALPEAAIPKTEAWTPAPSPSSVRVDGRTCAPLVPAVAFEGTPVHAAPDRTAPVLFTLATKTAVCAGAAAQGFGFRRVKLVNGTEGFIRVSDFSE